MSSTKLFTPEFGIRATGQTTKQRKFITDEMNKDVINVVWFFHSHAYSKDNVRDMIDYWELDRGIEFDFISPRSTGRMKIWNGSTIRICGANATLRGYKFDMVVFDNSVPISTTRRTLDTCSIREYEHYNELPLDN